MTDSGITPGRRNALLQITLLLLAFVCCSCDSAEPTGATSSGSNQGLSFENLTLPRDQVLSGGPPKDGIPAVTDPEVVPAGEAGFLTPESRVVGVELKDESRAWPISILTYHEIVNDELGGVPIAVTYCPLCDSVAVFDRRGADGIREFGVSGLLYNSNVLMYSRDEEQGLWSQLQGQGVSASTAGTALKTLPVELTTWKDWKSHHPDTTVMSQNTGFNRDYSSSPYDSYFSSQQLMFPVKPESDRLPSHERVLGLWSGDGFLAVPFSVIGDEAHKFTVTVGGRTVQLRTKPEAATIRVVSHDEGVNWMYSFWFAWYAFHPSTQVFENPSD